MASSNKHITNEIHFNIQRKIVGNMTTESWQNIPHAVYVYEPDVTDFMAEYAALKAERADEQKITLNTVIMKALVEGLKAAPIMNSHIEFDRRLVRGKITTYSNIDISMPTVLPNGEMMTINLHNFENKNLKEMTNYVNDVHRRAKQTNLTEVMINVSLDNTFTALRHGKLIQTAGRLLGSLTGHYKISPLRGKAKKEYYSIPETDRLTKHDIEQGTVTISNLGSVYREQRGFNPLLEIIPPQVCVLSFGAAQEKPAVVTNKSGEKDIAICQILPICIAFDHRAMDFADIVPFMRKLDEIFADPSVIKNW